MELEHATFGELQHLITTAEVAGLVGRRAERVLTALHEVLDSERVRLAEEDDPSSADLSETAISDLIDPLAELNSLQGQLEAH